VNNSSPRQVTNETLGHVVGFQLPSNASSCQQVIDELSCYSVLVSSAFSKIVFVKLLGREEILDLELPMGIVGIHPILEQDVLIQLPDWSFSVCIEQIPLVSAFALTIDKCQGLTLSRLILGPLLYPSRRTPEKNGTLYMALFTSETISRLSHFGTYSK
jgi:hypothetical protein